SAPPRLGRRLFQRDAGRARRAFVHSNTRCGLCRHWRKDTSMRLILMRHGETEWNAEQRLQGQDNSLLSERGVAQVKRFRPYAKALKPARIIASDLGRTRQTVALIGHPDAPSDERFRELDMGEWTGLRKPDLIADHPEDYVAWRAGTFTPTRG